MGADKLFYVESIDTYAPLFFGYIYYFSLSRSDLFIWVFEAIGYHRHAHFFSST